jgi:kynurenine formamidase
MTDRLLAAVRRGIAVHDLSRPYVIGMPQSPNHPAYWRAMPRRHGDMAREDGSSAANDLITLGTHVGTHIDALGHVSQDGRLFGGASAETAQAGGGFPDHGIHTFAPALARGILLDVPAALGIGTCEPGYEITPEDLDAAVALAGATPEPGDVLLVRSGWGARWDEGAAYIGAASGVPGVSERGARWLAAHRPRAAGADSIAFERLEPGKGHALLPAHRVLLVEEGINIIETMNLEGIASAGVREFTIVLAPLPLVGATGSPVRPLAIVDADTDARTADA